MSSWDTQSQSLGSFQIGKEKTLHCIGQTNCSTTLWINESFWFGLSSVQLSRVRLIIVITIEIAIGKLITNKQTMKWMGIRWNEPMKYGHYVINKFDIKRKLF